MSEKKKISQKLNFKNIKNSIINIIGEQISNADTKQVVNRIKDVYESTPLDLNDTLNLISEIYKKDLDDTQIKKLIFEKTRDKESIFILSQLPSMGSINRKNIIKPLIDSVNHKISSITGIPKIGKTTLISQLCHSIKAKQNILWFEPPSESEFHNKFVNDVKISILKNHVSYPVLKEYIQGKIPIHKLIGNILVNNKTYTTIIIDNFQELPDSFIKEINIFFNNIKKSIITQNTSIILISNKRLELTSIDNEFSCPPFNIDELEKLITHYKINIKGNLKKYCEVLFSLTGGHPLFALSLARINNNILTLVLPKGIKTPKINNEKLDKPLEQYLFNSLLTTEDERNLVIRLSSFIHRLKIDEIEYLAQNIKPIIKKNIKLLVDKIKNLVIEGDDSIGYTVNQVLKNIARKYISENQMINNYKIFGFYLTKLDSKKTIIAQSFLDGILYLLMSKEYKEAISKLFFFIYSIHKKNLTNNQIIHILDKVEIFLAFNLESTLKSFDLLSLCAILYQISNYYKILKKPDQAIKYIEKINIIIKKIDFDQVNKLFNRKGILDKYKPLNEEISNVFKFLYLLDLMLLKDYKKAILILEDINRTTNLFDLSTKFKDKIRIELIEVLENLIRELKFEEIPFQILSEYVNKITLNNSKEIINVANCFIDIGIKIDEDITYKKLSDQLTIQDNILKNIFIYLTLAQYDLQKTNYNESLKTIELIEELFQKNDINNKYLYGKIYFLKADNYYFLTDLKNSNKYYLKVIRISDPQSYDFIYSKYKLYLYLEPKNKDLNILLEVIDGFKKLYLFGLQAIAIGEKAIYYYQHNDILKSITTLQYLIDEYYINNKEYFGLSASLSVNILVYIQAKLNNKEIESEQQGLILTKPEYGVYSRINLKMSPIDKKLLTYYLLGDIYLLLGESGSAQKMLNIARNEDCNLEEEYYAKYVTLLELIKLNIDDNKKLNSLLKDFTSIEEKFNKIPIEFDSVILLKNLSTDQVSQLKKVINPLLIDYKKFNRLNKWNL